jgi:putative resolvase
MPYVDTCVQVGHILALHLSQYAEQQGISSWTAFRWFRAGTIKGYQALTATISVPVGQPVSSCPEQVAVSARVSSAERKDPLERQTARLSACCAARLAGS